MSLRDLYQQELSKSNQTMPSESSRKDIEYTDRIKKEFKNEHDLGFNGCEIFEPYQTDDSSQNVINEFIELVKPNKWLHYGVEIPNIMHASSQYSHFYLIKWWNGEKRMISSKFITNRMPLDENEFPIDNPLFGIIPRKGWYCGKRFYTTRESYVEALKERVLSVYRKLYYSPINRLKKYEIESVDFVKIRMSVNSSLAIICRNGQVFCLSSDDYGGNIPTNNSLELKDLLNDSQKLSKLLAEKLVEINNS